MFSKKTINFGLCLVFFLALSCSKKAGNEDGIHSIGEMVAQVDGSKWTATGATGTYKINEELLSIVGTKPDGTGISITLVEVAGSGKYELGSTQHVAIWQASTSAADAYSTLFNGSGEVTITTFTDQEARGSFSFIARSAGGQTVNISGGSFEVDLVD